MNFKNASEWASTLKALAHPTRLQIVAELLKGTKCVTDIQDLLPASQANISQHLTVLRHARLVDFSQSGAQRCYFVCQPELTAGILQLLGGEVVYPVAPPDRCCLSVHQPRENPGE
ncbi:MAG: ArsR/SmtB family transcription factor [Desulfuromonadales bacterium]